MGKMGNLKLIILCGGNSSERNVSVCSGNAIYDSLIESYSVDLINYSGNIEKYLSQLKSGDLVINALHGGDGENGIIQTYFEQNKIKYTGSNSESSKIAMDKNLTKSIAVENNINTPRWVMSKNGEFESFLNKIINLGFPLVVKPANEGSTMGLSIINSTNEIAKAFEIASKFSNEIMFEEFIPGKELTIGILGDRYLPIVEIVPTHELYDYECKYTKGMSKYYCPAELDENVKQKMQKDSLKLHKILGCRHYSRVDFRLTRQNKYSMLEINTLPGMTSTSLLPKAAKADKISFYELLNKIIELAI
tara:strand:+ start:2531 stop:3448 length:918 start_codon:yes stop_codon:yes gene_type:complete